MTPDQKYMRRALQLAAKGYPYASPNPMVGAVITDRDGTIIGEGYHRRCGGPHAEVNAVNSVTDRHLLKEATMYVTLEPCAHYGRTPPCAKLIIDSGIPNVVVGCRDPFDKVDGKGIDMLTRAGVNVTVGMLEHECRELNAVFFTAHTQHRPFITLKWAQSADGYMDIIRDTSQPAVAISSQLTAGLMHRLRAGHDAILVGSGTMLADHPSLTTRLWAGPSPRPIILDRRNRVSVSDQPARRQAIVVNDDRPLETLMHDLYGLGITSVLVEGGPTVLRSFIDERLWDVARVEISADRYGDRGRAEAPVIRDTEVTEIRRIDGHLVKYYVRNTLIDVKNI